MYLIKRRRRPKRPVLHWSQWRVVYSPGEIWVSPAVIQDVQWALDHGMDPFGEKLGESFPPS